MLRNWSSEVRLKESRDQSEQNCDLDAAANKRRTMQQCKESSKAVDCDVLNHEAKVRMCAIV